MPALRNCMAVPLTVLLLAGCASSHHLQGTMQVTADHPAMLRIEGPQLANVHLELASRGPQDVHFEQQVPTATETSDSLLLGMLPANGEALHWSGATNHLELWLSVARGEASVGYSIRSDRGVSLTVGSR